MKGADGVDVVHLIHPDAKCSNTPIVPQRLSRRKGLRTKSWTIESGPAVRMCGRDDCELCRRGTRASEKVVRRLMREEDTEARRRRRQRRGSFECEPDERPATLPRERAGGAKRATGEYMGVKRREAQAFRGGRGWVPLRDDCRKKMEAGRGVIGCVRANARTPSVPSRAAKRPST